MQRAKHRLRDCNIDAKDNITAKRNRNVDQRIAFYSHRVYKKKWKFRNRIQGATWVQFAAPTSNETSRYSFSDKSTTNVVRMHFKQHQENRAKYVTSDPKIGQKFVWPFLIQVTPFPFPVLRHTSHKMRILTESRYFADHRVQWKIRHAHQLRPKQF